MSTLNFSASHLTHPILYRLPIEASASVFSELYYRGAKSVVPIALISTLCSGLAAYLDPEKRVGYAVAAAASFATLPFTRCS